MSRFDQLHRMAWLIEELNLVLMDLELATELGRVGSAELRQYHDLMLRFAATVQSLRGLHQALNEYREQ